MGDLTASTFSGFSGLGGTIQVQVPEADAGRAAAALAACAGGGEPDQGWESEAEDDADVWVCSLCGEPVRAALSVCPSCQTAREAVRNSPPGHTPAAPARRAGAA